MEPKFIAKKSIASTISIWRILFFWLIIPLIVQIAKTLRAASYSLEFYDNKIVTKWGIFARNEKQCVFAGVRAVTLSQTLKGRIFNYGNVSVDCVGKWDVDTSNIKNPLDLKRFLESRITGENMTTLVTDYPPFMQL